MHMCKWAQALPRAFLESPLLTYPLALPWLEKAVSVPNWPAYARAETASGLRSGAGSGVCMSALTVCTSSKESSFGFCLPGGLTFLHHATQAGHSLSQGCVVEIEQGQLVGPQARPVGL